MVSTYLLPCILLCTSQVLATYPDNCGQPAIPPHVTAGTERVINGEEVTPHSFPWQISIKGAIDEHYCGGSILSPYWVLTSAHCAKIVFLGENYGDVVVVGQHDRYVCSPQPGLHVMDVTCHLGLI